MSCLNELYDNIVNGLPKRPERPLDSDCCGQGCVPCVFDLYEEEVKIWEEECRKVKHGGKIEENIKVKFHDGMIGFNNNKWASSWENLSLGFATR